VVGGVLARVVLTSGFLEVGLSIKTISYQRRLINMIKNLLKIAIHCCVMYACWAYFILPRVWRVFE